MFLESDFLPISALQHLLFCERQCCLIHVEQIWIENRLTSEGRVLHANVHEQGDEARNGVLITHGLKLKSFVLGLTGVADVVEFHFSDLNGIELANRKGLWSPFPVEYKRGKPKNNSSDEVQLCAQALCLEEMLKISIEKGALYYGSEHKRHEIEFSELLRKETVKASQRLHKIIDSGITSPTHYEKHCDSCSMIGVCMPKIFKKDAKEYLEKYIYQE
jgi:CRISPR-associated exonuclease Cas4